MACCQRTVCDDNVCSVLRIFRDDVHPHADAVAPPAHLKFEPRVDRHDTTEEDLEETPGYWMEFEEKEDGTVVRTTMQTPGGRAVPKKNKGQGLYLRGTVPAEKTTIKPLEEIPMLSGLAKLANKDIDTKEK
eukprot:TRINITY_DN5909_c0_g1_i2.p2 TRINITY_DN5909_c0_g1~~TRINITY_DN5909_c0_g1_i2.p2  ORF type:complete len:132 (-),score=37.66 TRINITY_DN5909_c0_g1_i2:28-423(-)